MVRNKCEKNGGRERVVDWSTRARMSSSVLDVCLSCLMLT
jgi:hypothetical protein